MAERQRPDTSSSRNIPFCERSELQKINVDRNAVVPHDEIAKSQAFADQGQRACIRGCWYQSMSLLR